MKKIVAIWAVSLLALSSLQAQVRLTTTLQKGEALSSSFLSVVVPKGETVTVNWGDGSSPTVHPSYGSKIFLGHDFVDDAAEHTIVVQGIEHATELTIISNKKVTDIRFESMPDLTSLSIANNLITTLDVTPLTKLQMLVCNANRLTDIKLPPTITKLNCSFNDLAIGELPRGKNLQSNYAPQHRYQLREGELDGLSVDLSRHLYPQSVEGMDQPKTTFEWRLKKDDSVIPPTSYKYDGEGHFSFYAAPEGEVYCIMSNTAFPNFTLNRKYITDFLTLTGEAQTTITKPIVFITTDKYTTGSLTANLILKAKKPASLVRIDWGDKTVEEYTVGLEETTIKHIFIDSKVDLKHKIALEGEELYALKIVEGFYLTDLEAGSAVSQLTELTIEANDLAASMNGLLDLSNFTSLKSLKLTGTHLRGLTLSPQAPIALLELSNNGLTQIHGLGLAQLEEARLAYNKLTALDLSNAGKLIYLDVQANALESLKVPITIQYLFCQNNHLPLSQLPQRQESHHSYIYAPQLAWAIPQQCVVQNTIDLSGETNLKDIASAPQVTTFVWHDEKKDIPLIFTQFREVRSGVFAFSLEEDIMSYCSMETSAFPADVPFRTKAMLLPKGTYTLFISGTDALKVYPNPCYGFVTIETQGSEQIEIFSLDGGLVRVLDGMAKNLELEFPVGDYLVRQGSQAVILKVLP